MKMLRIVLLALTVFTVSVTGQFCNFDHSFCDYTNDPSAPMTWEQYDGHSHGHGHEQIAGSGPSEDHTHQGGHGHGWFMMSNCGDNLPGDEARMISPPLMGTAFLDFWYTMNGGDLDLSIYILQGGQETQVWNIRLLDDSSWQRGSTALDPPNFYEPYQIAFVTVRGSDRLCHVAIDDVNINIVATPAPPTTTMLPTTAKPETASPTDAPTDAMPATTVPPQPTKPETVAPTDAAAATTVPPQPATTKPVTAKPTDAATSAQPQPTTTMPTTTVPTTTTPTTTMPTTPEPTTIKPTTPQPTKPGMVITCDSDVIQVVIDKNAAPELDEHTTHLIDSTCVGTVNATHLMFETALDACGTTRQETENYIIYSNAIEQRVGGISFTGNLDFHCAISRETLVSGVFTPVFTPGSGKVGRLINYDPFVFGEYNTEMKFYNTSSYQIEQVSPVNVGVGNYLYVETRLHSSDKNLRIRATRCIATTTTDPDSQPQYVVIDNKCSTSDSVLQPLPSPSPEVQRFSMSAFKFNTAPDNSPVYLHCYLLVCFADPGSPCEDTCARSGKARREAPASEVRLSVEVPVKNTKLFHPGAAAIAGAVGVIALVGTALVVRRYRKSHHPTQEIDM